MRKKPRSSRRTAQASTCSRSSSSPREVGRRRARAARAARGAKLDHVVELLAGRGARASAGGRGTACARAASMPVAWMWPPGYGQIHTSSHAGGMTSSWIRARTSASSTRLAVGVEVAKAAPVAPARGCRGRCSRPGAGVGVRVTVRPPRGVPAAARGASFLAAAFLRARAPCAAGALALRLAAPSSAWRRRCRRRRCRAPRRGSPSARHQVGHRRGLLLGLPAARRSPRRRPCAR